MRLWVVAVLAGLPWLGACGGSEDSPALRPQRTYLFNLERAAMEVDGRAGIDFEQLQGVPRFEQLSCGDDRRRALVLNAGSELAIPGLLPRAGLLRFGVAFAEPTSAAAGASTSAVPSAFRLSIGARGPSGAQVEATTLWRQRVQRPSTEAERRWLDFEVDLSSAGPGALVLRVEAVRAAGTGPLDARWLPRFGNPVIEGPALAPRGGDSHPNVVVFLIDTLRADHVGAYGYPRPTTPRLDDLAREGVLFERAYATSSWTKPSVASLFTSRPPHLHGVQDFPHRLRDSEVTLAELFDAAGWDTAAIGTNAWVFDPRFNFAGGFGDFFMALDQRGPERSIGGADVVVDEAIDWVERHRDAPFLLYVHAFDPHMPYGPVPGVERFLDAPYEGSVPAVVRHEWLMEHAAELSDDDARYVEAAYDAEIAFADEHMGRLIDALRDLGLWEETTFVVVSDHGEEFRDHGWWGHSTTLYDELIRVPLVLKPPASAARGPQRIAEPVSLTDVAPTLCKLAGIDMARAPFQGRDLLAPGGLPGVPLHSSIGKKGRRQFAVIDGYEKFVVSEHPFRGEMYLRLDRDPGEQNSVLESADPERLRVLRAQIDELRALSVRDGLYLELYGDGASLSLRGVLRADGDFSDVDVWRTEWEYENTDLSGDRAYFPPGTRQVIAFELSVGPEDEHDYVQFAAADGAQVELLLQSSTGVLPSFGVGAQRPTGGEGQPMRFSPGDAALRTPGLPEVSAGSGPFVRVFRLERERADVDAELAERLRALGYDADE